MNHPSLKLIRVALALLPALALNYGCASKDDDKDDAKGGTSATGAVTNTGNVGNESTGATTTGGTGNAAGTTSSVAGTTSTAGSAATGACAIATACSTTCAKTGAQCDADCDVECGFAGIGTKHCTCEGGFFSMCPCPVPAAYMGAPTAGYCDALTQAAVPDAPADSIGMTLLLKGKACTTEWEECIGRDPYDSTPRGCACIMSVETQALEWFCGSTNKWFALDPSAI